MKSPITALLVLIAISGFLLAAVTFCVFAQEITLIPTSDSDDFSGDSGLWQIIGDAFRDQSNQYLVLTESTNNQGGAAIFKAPIKSSFTATFSYKVGGGSGGDGFTLFFYKQEFSTVADGGSLGFETQNDIIPGYGIEFDGWQNIPGDFRASRDGDPSANHIALIKDHASNHMIHVNDQRTEDNKWHTAKISVDIQVSSVNVFVDQELVLQWTGDLNRTFGGFGFSAGTGCATNQHLIDNFSLKFHGMQKPILTLSCMSSTSYAGFNVEIKGSLALNGTAIANAPIFLCYSVTGGKTWEDLTLVYTDSGGAYSAAWLPSVTGNFQVKATFEGDADNLGAIAAVNMAVAQFAENNVFSVSSNSTVTSLAFNSENHELNFKVSGESGTTGYADVYVAKTIVGDIANVKVYLDDNQIEYTTSSEGDSWLLHFSYQHSTHEVLVSLGVPPSEILGNPLALALIVVGILAAPLATALLIVKRRSSKKEAR